MNNVIRKTIGQCFLSVFILLIALESNAETPISVGIISSIDGSVSIINGSQRKVDFGDDIIYKDTIRVGPDSSLIVTYYAGCRQEWIAENTILEIGQSKSKIIKGKILKSEVFDCEVPEVVLSDKDSFKKAAFHFRGVATVESDSNNMPEMSPQLLSEIKSKSKRVDKGKYSANDIKLRMWTAKKDGMYYRSGEHIIIYLVANRDAYLHLNYFQVDGNVVHLVPNIFEDKNKIKAGQIYVVGGNKSKLKLIVEHPYGEEKFSAIVSATPFDNAFNRMEIIEKTEKYTQKINQLLSKNQNNKIAEYELGIWSIP